MFIQHLLSLWQQKTQLPKNEIQFVIYANQAANNSLIYHAENN